MKITAVERNRFNWIGAVCAVDLLQNLKLFILFKKYSHHVLLKHKNILKDGKIITKLYHSDARAYDSSKNANILAVLQC